jgi:tryptophan-rich sensory protein
VDETFEHDAAKNTTYWYEQSDVSQPEHILFIVACVLHICQRKITKAIIFSFRDKVTDFKVARFFILTLVLEQFFKFLLLKEILGAFFDILMQSIISTITTL